MIGYLQRAWNWAVKRISGYAGAEKNRITAKSNPRNLSADLHLLGPNGGDALRAWANELCRQNAYAQGVVDTIVSSVVGVGIRGESTFEPDGREDLRNEARQRAWERWIDHCELSGRYDFYELQQVSQAEMTRAGEVLIRMINVPPTKDRPIPFALEIIEADRLASDRDTYAIARDGNKRIVRGVEMDDAGTPIAYWIYPDHPRGVYSFYQEPVRIVADDIIHLYRKDRAGQSRGASWFAPVMGVMRDLGTYVDHEMQAAAISACDMTLITTATPLSGPNPGSNEDGVDENDNPLEFYEAGRVYNLRPGEGVEHINPARPNSNAEPWINLMLRGIAVGTGLSFETVARDYSGTNYSSNRASQLEDRRRFRQWQNYLIRHLCKRVWRRFVEAASLAGHFAFPSMTQIETDFQFYAPMEWHPPTWEWVDPQNEQAASESSIRFHQSTYQIENGRRGQNYKNTFKQAAKEKQERKALGLLTIEEMEAEAEMMKAQAALMTAQAAQKTANTNAESAEVSL